MKQYRVHIPLPAIDNDGIEFPADDIQWLESRLIDLAGGFRKHPNGVGAWRSDGRLYEEPVTEYVVTLSAERWPLLEQLLEQTAETFRQEAVLAEFGVVESRLFTRSNTVVAVANSI
jgi:hypothetical protein